MRDVVQRCFQRTIGHPPCFESWATGLAGRSRLASPAGSELVRSQLCVLTLRHCTRTPTSAPPMDVLTVSSLSQFAQMPPPLSLVDRRRAVLLDTMGHPLLHATISAGMGYRNISVVTALGQKLVKVS